MYAIVETGGKQYRVSSGQVVDVDKMVDTYDGDAVELDKVLLIADNDKVTVGNPVIEGAVVKATCQGDRRTAKVIVLHYKPKVRYHKKNGHRQSYTRLLINDITGPGITGEPVKKPRRSKKEVTEEVTEDGA